MEFDVFDKISDLETKLHYMREQLKEKDDIIASLRSEIESLKGNNYYDHRPETSTKTAIESLADSGKSIADSLKEVSDSCMQSTGYIYDEKTGLYYDKNSGYYYDPENQLFFNPRSGTYHTYDPETKEYSYHSRASASELKKIIEENSIKASLASVANRMKEETKARSPSPKRSHRSRSNSSHSRRRHRSRSGHRSHRHSRRHSRSRSSSQRSHHRRRRKRHGDSSPVVYEAPTTLSSTAVKYPPVLRCSILSSKCYNVGKLVVITSKDALSRWATIGKNNSLCPIFPFERDDDMEDMHCEITFSREKHIYSVKDKHTKNGTFLNGKKLERSHRQPIAHGDVLRIGTNRILLHIHEGSAQCDQCAGVEKPDTKIKPSVEIDPSKEIPEEELIDLIEAKKETEKVPRELNRRNMLKDLKSKYGLLGEDAASRTDKLSKGDSNQYKDRAADRRKYRPDKNPIPSLIDPDLPIEPLPPLSEVEKSMKKADLETPIDHENNVGAKLMGKMGWTPGVGLGKNEAGIAEPIKVINRGATYSGFGAETQQNQNIPQIPRDPRKEMMLKKTRERYENT